MSSKEFLAYIRKRIGNYCSDRYWLLVYYHLESIDHRFIKKIRENLVLRSLLLEAEK